MEEFLWRGYEQETARARTGSATAAISADLQKVNYSEKQNTQETNAKKRAERKNLIYIILRVGQSARISCRILSLSSLSQSDSDSYQPISFSHLSPY